MPTTVATPTDVTNAEKRVTAKVDSLTARVVAVESINAIQTNDYAALVAMVESLADRVTALESPIIPPVLPPVPPPVPPGDSVLFDLRHLRQTGVWSLPYWVGDSVTAYTAGLCAARVVDGEKVFLGQSRVEFFTYRLLDNGATEVIDRLGLSILGGSLRPGKSINGLFVNPDEPDALYWCGDLPYDTVDGADVCAFRTRFAPGTWDVIGVDEFPNPPGSNNLQTRGGFARLPGGKIARGHGGYYSIFGGTGSYGPCLVAQDGTVYLRYSYGHRAPRPNDYFMQESSEGDAWWMGRDGGTWTGGDEIGGEDRSSACVVLDGVVPGIRGTLFTVQQGIGRIGYDAGKITRGQGFRSRLYWYDTADLLAVSRGEKSEWEPTAHYADLPLPNYIPTIGDYSPAPLVTGGCLDYTTGNLYLVWINANPVGREWSPILVKYSFVR